MTDSMKDAWMHMMKKKFSTDEAGVRQIMRDRQQKSMAAPNRKKGGFSTMDTAKVKEISRQGLNKRYHKDDENQQTAPGA